MGSTSNVLFTGASSYAKDFQNVITRAVSIASLPITQLTLEQTSITNQNDELKVVSQKVAAVRSALDNLGTALSSSFDCEISDPTVLSATVGEGAIEGNYSVLVSDAGAYSTMMTGTWTAADGAAHTYALKIGDDSFDVTPADNSAVSVAAAINKTYGDQVRATVVNVNTADNPDYRVSLQSVALTGKLLDLTDGASLKATQTAGKPAQYEVNGSGVTVQSASRTVTIADGVTITLKSNSADSANLTVTRSTAALNSALSGFVTAYNGAVAELDGQRGTAAGGLQGNALVSDISSTLSQIATYATSGAFSGLRDLGLELQKDGTIVQNQFTLIGADLQNAAGVTSFFSAFLKAAGTAMNRLDDPLNGLLSTAENGFTSRLDTLTQKIADKQADIDALQLKLQDQMAAADALIAAMEQQYSFMSNMFSSMRSAADQYK